LSPGFRRRRCAGGAAGVAEIVCPNGALLAGTSPKGAVYLIRDGKTLARVGLPSTPSSTSCFSLRFPRAQRRTLQRPDFPGGSGRDRQPRPDLSGCAGPNSAPRESTRGRLSIRRGLAAQGRVTLFGEMRDRTCGGWRSCRTAGSPPAPRAWNVLSFPAQNGGFVTGPASGNHEAEGTDPAAFKPNGDPYATVFIPSSPGDTRIPGPGGAGATPAFSAGRRSGRTRMPGRQRPPPAAASEGPSADRFGRPQLRGFLSRRRFPRQCC